MDRRSLARSGFGHGNGRKFSAEESDFDEFHGYLRKSPMRDRFLNDLSSAPVSLSYDSPLPIRERGSDDGDFDGVGISPDMLKTVSKSPVSEWGGKSSMSERTRNVSMSPLRGTDTVKRSPGTMDQDISNSPLREGFVSKFDDRMEKEQGDEEVWRDRMTPKTSFNAWLPEDSRSRPSNDISFDRRRQQCRDGVSDEFDQISEGKVSVYADEHGMTSEGSVDDLIHGGDSIRETIDRDLRVKEDYAERYSRPRVNADQRFGGNYGNEVFRRNSRVPIESGRMSASSSSLDGPSSYYLDSVHGYVRSRQSGDVRRGPANIHYMEHLEFQHKYQEHMERYPPKELNELDDLFSSAKLYSGADDYSEDFRYRRGSKQQFLPNNNMQRCSYFNHGPGLDYELDNTFNPSLYDDPYVGQMRRSRQQHFSQYPMPDYVPGQSLNYDRDSVLSYRTGVHVHHPIVMQGQYIPSFAYGMPPSSADDPAGRMNLQRPDPRMYYPKMVYTGPREQTPHLSSRHTKRVQVASQNKRLCLPLLGGSPFVICHKCFELLKLPGNFMTENKKVYQLQCGPCSYIMSFDLRDGSFNVLTFQKKPDLVKCTDVYNESLNESNPTHHHDSCADTSTSIGSYDFEGNSIQSTESEAREASRRQILALNLDEHARAISPSSRSSKERLSESISVRSSRSNSSEFPFKIRPPTGSPSREHLDRSN